MVQVKSYMLLLLSVNLHYFSSSERDMSIQETYRKRRIQFQLQNIKVLYSIKVSTKIHLKECVSAPNNDTYISVFYLIPTSPKVSCTQ